MKITSKIYKKACKAIEDGYGFVIISKNKKSYRSNVAIGEGFEIVSLIDIEESCDLSRNHDIEIKGKYSKKGEKIDLNRYGNIYIKYSDLMKKYPNKKWEWKILTKDDYKDVLLTKEKEKFLIDEISSEMNAEIKEMEEESYIIGVPYFFFTSNNLIKARKNNWWFYDDSGKGDEYIYVNYYRFSGVFTFDNGKTFKYRNGNKYVIGNSIEEIAEKAKKLDEIIKYKPLPLSKMVLKNWR